MPLPRFRDPERLRFTVSTARTVRLPATPEAPPLLPWPVAALGGGVVAGLAGSIVVAAVMVVAWLSAIAIALPTVLEFAAQVWLLAHGGVLSVGQDRVTLVPLGLTIAFAALCSSAGRFAYRQGRQSRTDEPDERARRRLVLGSAGQVAAGYVAVAVVLAWVASGPAQVWRPALGALAVSGVGALLGAGRAAGYRLLGVGPQWVRRAARGAAAGALGLVAVAAITLGTALLLGEQRIAALEDAVGFDGGGILVWSLVMLAYLPTLLSWVLAWLLGAGFTLGTGTLVSLSTTQLGMMPAVPVFGALPEVGAADPWLLSWLAAGVAVGVLTGVAAAGAGRTSVLGGLAGGASAGLLVGILAVGFAAASRGGLGVLRLAELGPRLPELLMIGVPLLLLSACLGSIGTWLVRRRRPAA